MQTHARTHTCSNAVDGAAIIPGLFPHFLPACAIRNDVKKRSNSFPKARLHWRTLCSLWTQLLRMCRCTRVPLPGGYGPRSSQKAFNYDLTHHFLCYSFLCVCFQLLVKHDVYADTVNVCTAFFSSWLELEVSSDAPSARADDTSFWMGTTDVTAPKLSIISCAGHLTRCSLLPQFKELWESGQALGRLQVKKSLLGEHQFVDTLSWSWQCNVASRIQCR